MARGDIGRLRSEHNFDRGIQHRLKRTPVTLMDHGRWLVVINPVSEDFGDLLFFEGEDFLKNRSFWRTERGNTGFFVDQIVQRDLMRKDDEDLKLVVKAL